MKLNLNLGVSLISLWSSIIRLDKVSKEITTCKFNESDNYQHHQFYYSSFPFMANSHKFLISNKYSGLTFYIFCYLRDSS